VTLGVVMSTTSDAGVGSAVEAQLSAARQGWWHVEVECRGVADEIVETLSELGPPYAYTVVPENVMAVDGAIPHQVIATTKEQIHAAYTEMHKIVQVNKLNALTEIRTDWYTFIEGIGESEFVENGEKFDSAHAVLFPTHGGVGISGELFWLPTQSTWLGDGSSDRWAERLPVLKIHERLVECLRTHNVDGVIALTRPNAQTCIRDYVEETGGLNELHSTDELRSYLDAFYDRFRVVSIDLLHRHISHWMMFAELLWTVELKSGPQTGERRQFRTAEHAEVAADGMITARIGHGTPLVPAPQH